MRIIITVATKCRILRLKCTKFDFGWGSAPDPAEGAYSAPLDPIAAFKGATSKGSEGKRKEGMGREEKGGKKGERTGSDGRQGKNVLPHSKQAVAAYECCSICKQLQSIINY